MKYVHEEESGRWGQTASIFPCIVYSEPDDHFQGKKQNKTTKQNKTKQQKLPQNKTTTKPKETQNIWHKTKQNSKNL